MALCTGVCIQKLLVSITSEVQMMMPNNLQNKVVGMLKYELNQYEQRMIF